MQEKKKEVVSFCSRPPQNLKSGTFPLKSRAVTTKTCTKKRDARAELLFCLSYLLLELPKQIQQRYDKEGNNYSKNMNKRTDATE